MEDFTDMGLYDAILADSRRDGTHAFSASDNPELCEHCGKRRWAHVQDGFRYKLSPEVTKEQDLYLRKSAYSRHPSWSPPQGASRAEAKEKMKQEIAAKMASDRKHGRTK